MTDMDMPKLAALLTRARVAAMHREGDALVDLFDALDTGKVFHEVDKYTEDYVNANIPEPGTPVPAPRQTATVRGPVDSRFTAIVDFAGIATVPSTSDCSSPSDGGSSASCGSD